MMSELIVEVCAYAVRLNAERRGASSHADFFVSTKVFKMRNSWLPYALLVVASALWAIGPELYRIFTKRFLDRTTDVVFVYVLVNSLFLRLTTDKFWRRQLELNARELRVRIPEYV